MISIFACLLSICLLWKRVFSMIYLLFSFLFLFWGHNWWCSSWVTSYFLSSGIIPDRMWGTIHTVYLYSISICREIEPGSAICKVIILPAILLFWHVLPFLNMVCLFQLLFLSVCFVLYPVVFSCTPAVWGGFLMEVIIYTNFSSVCSLSLKNIIGLLIGIPLNLSNALDRMLILAVLIFFLPIICYSVSLLFFLFALILM